jgi:hypothetical protein
MPKIQRAAEIKTQKPINSQGFGLRQSKTFDVHKHSWLSIFGIRPSDL